MVVTALLEAVPAESDTDVESCEIHGGVLSAVLADHEGLSMSTDPSENLSRP